MAGLVSGLVYGFGALSMYLTGWLGDRAARRRPAGRLNIAWLSLVPATPLLLLALAAAPGKLWLCAFWLLPACMALYAYYGTVYATIQDIIEPRLRGRAMAIYFFGMYVLGAVWGPFVTGWLSDGLAERAAGGSPLSESHKASGLHGALYLIPILNVFLVMVLFAASRTVAGDLRRRRERSVGV
jgi:MFS family permease